jgi:hypothetical protein
MPGRPATAKSFTHSEGVEDFIAGHHLTGVGCQQIQQALIHPGQVQLGRSNPHLPLQDVDLQLSQLHHGL